MIDVSAYLRRLNYGGSTAPTLAALRALHLAHLYAVPFENLDIHLGRRIELDEEKLFDKIVVRRRGGFCYELNGLFAALLRGLGFDVSLLAAGVYEAEHERFGPEYDHMVLLVRLDEPWLADVGFGDSFREPLQLNNTDDQIQNGMAYRLVHDGDEWRMMERGLDGKWADGYQFTLRPRRLYDFTYGCHYMQTSPDSHFTQKRICSRATPDGRITLSDMRLILTANGQRQERSLADEAEYRLALKEYFDITLSHENLTGLQDL
jgi:N-hydroxyarylamine O-acetyltransferase